MILLLLNLNSYGALSHSVAVRVLTSKDEVDWKRIIPPLINTLSPIFTFAVNSPVDLKLHWYPVGVSGSALSRRDTKGISTRSVVIFIERRKTLWTLPLNDIDGQRYPLVNEIIISIAYLRPSMILSLFDTQPKIAPCALIISSVDF